jgi:leucyl-tRNA synthetase
MIRDWFNATEVVEFGRTVARDVTQIFPSTPGSRKTHSLKKDRKKLDSILRRTREFAQQHRLNVYKKAKLLNTVKWELREAGQNEDVIDEVIALLAPLLS